MSLVSRDPFARQELHRSVVHIPHYNSYLPLSSQYRCWNCGGTRKNGTIFKYRLENDDNSQRPGDVNGYFCSVGCMRSFHS